MKSEKAATPAATTAPASKCGEDELEILGECKAKPVCNPKYNDTCIYGCFNHFDFFGKPDSCACMENTEPAANNNLVCVPVSRPSSTAAPTTTPATTTTTAATATGENSEPVYLLTGAPEDTFNGEYILDEESNKLKKITAVLPTFIIYDDLTNRWSISLMNAPAGKSL